MSDYYYIQERLAELRENFATANDTRDIDDILTVIDGLINVVFLLNEENAGQ